MEPLIRNESILDQAVYTEIVKRTQGMGRRVAASVFGALLIVYTIWTLTIFQNILLQSICALLGVALILLGNLEYRLLAPKGYRQQQTLAAGAPLRFYTEFFEEGIEVTGPTGSRVHIPYENIKKVYDIPQGMIICMKDKMGMFLAEDGYKAGSREEAAAVLEKNCLQLNRKETEGKK